MAEVKLRALGSAWCGFGDFDRYLEPALTVYMTGPRGIGFCARTRGRAKSSTPARQLCYREYHFVGQRR